MIFTVPDPSIWLGRETSGVIYEATWTFVDCSVPLIGLSPDKLIVLILMNGNAENCTELHIDGLCHTIYKFAEVSIKHH